MRIGLQFTYKELQTIIDGLHLAETELYGDGLNEKADYARKLKDKLRNIAFSDCLDEEVNE